MNICVTLSILEIDIVSRLVSLDECILKDQRLKFTVRYDEIDRICFFYENFGLWVALASLEVTMDAFFKILCFPHVDYVISGIFEEIASWVFRESGWIDHGSFRVAYTRSDRYTASGISNESYGSGVWVGLLKK